MYLTKILGHTTEGNSVRSALKNYFEKNSSEKTADKKLLFIAEMALKIKFQTRNQIRYGNVGSKPVNCS